MAKVPVLPPRPAPYAPPGRGTVQGCNRSDALLDLLRRLLIEGKITINDGRKILRLSRVDAG